MRLKTAAFSLCLILISVTLKSFQAAAEENQARRKYKIDELIGLAIEKNPSLSSAIAGIEIAIAELRSAKAYPNPEVEFSLARGESREDDNIRREYAISVSQSIEWPLKRLYRKKAAEQEVRVGEFEKEAVRAEIIYTAKRLYYSILLAKMGAESAERNLDNSRTIFSIVRRRVELGESRELDFIKARIETLKSERELARAESDLSALKAVLNSFVGDSLPKDFDLEGELAAPLNALGLEEISQRTARFNPELKAQAAQVKRAGLSLHEQQNSIIPDISLQGFYERELDKTALGGGIGITIPLWNQNRGGIRRARAEERKAEFDLKILEIEIGNSLREEYANYKLAFEQSKIFSGELLDRAKRSLEIAEFSYEQGETELLDVLDALRTYRETLGEYYKVLFELYVSKIALEKIAGGEI